MSCALLIIVKKHVSIYCVVLTFIVLQKWIVAPLNGDELIEICAALECKFSIYHLPACCHLC